MSGPLFQARHYTKLAAVFLKMRSRTHTNEQRLYLDLVVMQVLLSELAKDNPNLNKHRFLEAAGMLSDVVS